MRYVTFGAALLLTITAGIASAQTAPSESSSPAASVTPAPVKGPVRVAGGVLNGLIEKRVDPTYPSGVHARGVVVLHVIVSDEGKVVKVDPVSGPTVLLPAATAAVSQWRFRPYHLRSGQAISVDTSITVRFQ